MTHKLSELRGPLLKHITSNTETPEWARKWNSHCQLAMQGILSNTSLAYFDPWTFHKNEFNGPPVYALPHTQNLLSINFQLPFFRISLYALSIIIKKCREIVLDRSLMIGWRKNSWNPRYSLSSVCILGWVILGTQERKVPFFFSKLSFFHFYFQWHFSIFFTSKYLFSSYRLQSFTLGCVIWVKRTLYH